VVNPHFGFVFSYCPSNMVVVNPHFGFAT